MSTSHRDEDGRGGFGRDGSGRDGSGVHDVGAAADPPGPAVRPRARLTGLLRTAFVLRGAVLWFAVHLAMAFLGQLVLVPLQVAFLLAVVYTGVAVDQKVRREDLLLGNAGVSPRAGPVWALGTAAALEAALQAVAAGIVR